MWEVLDQYCERVDASFWAEPWNALTNLAFLAAAYGAWTLTCQDKRRNVRLLSWLIALIGGGSFLFHTFANRLTMWLDVLPILLFQLVYLSIFLRRVVALGWLEVLCGLAGYLLAGPVIAAALNAVAPAANLNGSEAYFPALIAIAFMAMYAHTMLGGVAVFFWAAGLFILSLALRTVDQRICAHWPLGTHFLWHCLNAAVLYLMVRGLIAALTIRNKNSSISC